MEKGNGVSSNQNMWVIFIEKSASSVGLIRADACQTIFRIFWKIRDFLVHDKVKVWNSISLKPKQEKWFDDFPFETKVGNHKKRYVLPSTFATNLGL